VFSPDLEGIMRTYRSGDLWTEAGLLRVEEMLADARAVTARRALLREARFPRRTVRVWLGTALLAVARRLLRSAPETLMSPVSRRDS
jgi:hypothetical protein